MDDKHDGDFEILDLGPAYDKGHDDAEDDPPAQDGEAQPAVVIDLGEGAAPAQSPPLPRWQRWAIVAAVFVAGIAAGGYGWYASSQATDASRVELIALELNGEVWEPIEQSRFYVRVHNAGRRDVTVLDLRFPASPGQTSEPRQELKIPVGESVSLEVSGAPSCEAGAPQSLEADVHTDVGVATALIPLPAMHPTYSLIAMVCGSPYHLPPGDPGVYFTGHDTPTAAEASPFRMQLEMERAVGIAEILDVAVEAPGFAARATNLPILIERGIPRHVELIWSISDCEATHELGTVDIQLDFAEGEPVTTQLPPWAIAQLAGLAATECGP